MVKAGDVILNPAFVSHMEWDRRHYMNGPGETTLIVTMADGTKHRIRHQPQYYDGVDAYAVEQTILEALATGEPS